MVQPGARVPELHASRACSSRLRMQTVRFHGTVPGHHFRRYAKRSGGPDRSISGTTNFVGVPMASPTDFIVNVLVGAEGIPLADAKIHPLTLLVAKVEERAKRARWAYPLMYVAVGLAVVLSLHWFVAKSPDNWAKLVGAMLGMFSALIAFWKPDAEVTQAECRALLKKPLAGSDLSDLNKMLEVSGKTYEKVMKLLGAAVSYLAVYLVIGA